MNFNLHGFTTYYYSIRNKFHSIVYGASTWPEAVVLTMKRRELHEDQASASSNEDDESDEVSAAAIECKDVICGWRWSHLVGALVVFRTVNALVCYTAFVPDEYWQALEVAHNMVFGYPT